MKGIDIMPKVNTQTMIEMILEKEGWSNLFGYLQNICFEKDLPELYRELDNLIVNYIPEVK